MKQTAVEFLTEFIENNQYFIGNDLLEAMKQAKQIEKEQLRIGAAMKSLPDSDEIRMKARELDEKDFDKWWWETVYNGNVL